MKVHVQPEWSILGGLMKANFNKKQSELNEMEKNNPNLNKTGDNFYDYIGKFCNIDSQKQIHQLSI